MSKIVGSRVKKLRAESGFTQAELGERVGVSEAQIAAIENGRRSTKLSVAVQFSRLFNVSVDYLVGETDIPTRQ